MTPGHFGLAAGAKKFAPRVPLWALFLATYLLDVIFSFYSLRALKALRRLTLCTPTRMAASSSMRSTHTRLSARC